MNDLQQGHDVVIPTVTQMDIEKEKEFFLGKRAFSETKTYIIVCIRGHEMSETKGLSRKGVHKCGLCKKNGLDAIDQGYLVCSNKRCTGMYCKACGSRYRRIYDY
jgi:hypothetical protein